MFSLTKEDFSQILGPCFYRIDLIKKRKVEGIPFNNCVCGCLPELRGTLSDFCKNKKVIIFHIILIR